MNFHVDWTESRISLDQASCSLDKISKYFASLLFIFLSKSRFEQSWVHYFRSFPSNVSRTDIYSQISSSAVFSTGLQPPIILITNHHSHLSGFSPFSPPSKNPGGVANVTPLLSAKYQMSCCKVHPGSCWVSPGVIWRKGSTPGPYVVGCGPDILNTDSCVVPMFKCPPSPKNHPSWRLVQHFQDSQSGVWWSAWTHWCRKSEYSSSKGS